MGIIFNTAAILSGGLTALTLKLGIEPKFAFVLGAILLFIPLKFLIPFASKKAFSETGIIASIGVILGYVMFSFGLWHAFLFGVGLGYAYLYFWIFVMPRILK